AAIPGEPGAENSQPEVAGVNGAEATVPVKIMEKDRQVAKKDWTAVKDGAGWKLKSAPLP
ncbi:MAG: hypothetical protein K2V38_08850, partial [Gemmataceae bacterium]|nr:hypothetical protein [Gemmataceae bacterium]